MPKFTYKGETSNGTSVEQTVEAKDRYAVYDIARTNGHTVSDVSEVSVFSLKGLFNFKRINYFLSKVKADELVMATRNLSSMLNAGLPLSRSISVIGRQTKNPRMKGVMKSVKGRIDKGDAFHDALADFPKTFSQLYVSMVRAGEESGTLSTALETISLQLERSSTLRKKIKGAMIYPIIVIGVMIIIGILMMIYVMPTMINTFEQLGSDLPTMTKVLIGTSKFLTEDGLIAIVGTIVVLGTIVYLSKTKYGQRSIHYTLTRLPVIGNIVKEANSASTARTLSSLLTSGVDVVTALNITEDVLQNVFYKEVIADAAKRVEKGNQLSEVFIENEHLYPILVGEMILVGEETGQISKMLKEIAIFYENEVEQKTKNLSTIIEPLLMVVIGAGVGFFALAMIAPIYSISDSI